ncbi:MAG TPA: hypothetical protein VJ719_06865, partial [Chthoniobacterales bacterium]|nr:hypothetical protein [Chthoniobacterales bacterium]
MSTLRCITVLALWIALSSCNKERDDTARKENKPNPTPALPASDEPQFDACSLLTKEEIMAVEGSAVTATKNSGKADAGLSFTQCFFTTAEFNRSVSLA